MEPYRITTIASTAYREVEITVTGPGLDAGGRRFVFVTRDRAQMFVQSLNFAYAQGIEEGLKVAGMKRP